MGGAGACLVKAPDTITWIGEDTQGGAVGFRIGRSGDELIADFVGLGRLSADRGRGTSCFLPAPGASAALLAKVELSAVPALLRHLADKLTLHGSAAAWGGVAISCIGESGAGKSTLSAALCTRFGAELVADDTCALEFREGRVDLFPTERVHWLISGSMDPDPEGTAKWAVAPRALVNEPPRLAAVCRLTFDETAPGTSLQRLRGQHALAALVPAVIRFVIDEPDMHEREFEQLRSLAERVPIYELRRPRKASEIERSCVAVADLARSLGAP